MAELSPLEVRLQANIADFEKQMQRAKDMLDKQARAMDQRAGQLDRNLTKTGGRFGQDLAPALQRAGKQLQSFVLRAAAAGVAVGTLVTALRRTVDAADRFRQIEGRLAALTGSTERATAGFEAIQNIAQTVGVGVDEVASAFSRFTLAAEDIGATDDEVAQLTETILKLGRIGGASQQELSSGILQLGQALASGRLQGEELRSILENMPLVARQIADGLGVSVGQLREMGTEGELTARVVFDALLKGADDANKAFAEMPKTVEQAQTRMSNAFDMLAAKIDTAIGLSSTWAAIMTAVADEVERAARTRIGPHQFISPDLPPGTLAAHARFLGGDLNPPGGLKFRTIPSTTGTPLMSGVLPNFSMGTPLSSATLPPIDGSGRRVIRSGTRPDARTPGGGGTISAIDSALASIEAETRALERQTQTLGMNSRARAEFLARAELYDAAMRSGEEVTTAQREAIEAAVTAIGEATAALEAKQEAEEAATRAAEEATRAEQEKAQAIADGIDRMTNAIRSARSLEDALRNVAIAAIEVAAQGLFGGTGPAGGLMNKLLGVASGGLFGMLSGPAAAPTATSLVPGIGSIPMRAAGGPVSPGNRYLIGERGPEVFVPSMPGYVRPSGGGTGSGGGASVSINIDARGAQQGVAQQIERTMISMQRNITHMVRQAQAEGR